MRLTGVCLLLFVKAVTASTPAPAPSSGDPTEMTNSGCYLFGMNSDASYTYDFLASHTAKHSFTKWERSEAELFLDRYAILQEGAEAEVDDGKKKMLMPSTECTLLKGRIERALQDVPNGAVRAPATHALAALLLCAALAQHCRDP